MKRYIFLSLMGAVLVSTVSTAVLAQSDWRHERRQQGNIFTQPSIEQAWQAAVAEQKPLLVMFSTEGCVYCRKMLANTYSNPSVQKLLSENTISVHADASNYRALTKKLGIRGYPTSLLVSPSGQVLEFMEGYVDARAFVQRVSPLLSQRSSNATAAVASQSIEQ